MAFVNLTLLMGGSLVGIPIILHLVMRQQPKQLVFPALRFIQQRRESNRRQLQLRHWILLLLRCLAIALLAVGLARPSVASATAGSWIAALICVILLAVAAPATVLAIMQKRGRMVIGVLAAVTIFLLAITALSTLSAINKQPQVLIGDQEAPVATALVVDASPRMEYRRDNLTRLEQAKETAAWLIGQLPQDSHVAVLDSSLTASVFSVDLGAASKSVERLQTTGAPRPLGELIAAALELLETSELERKEVYIFTDLTREAWRDAESSIDLTRFPETGIYVIDVGVAAPENFSLGELQLSSQVLSKNSPLTIRVDLQHVGPGGSRAVELRLEEPDLSLPVIQDNKVVTPTAKQRARRMMELKADSAATVEFRLEGAPVGTHQGYVRIIGDDGLAIDNTRNFAIKVAEAWPVLLVAPDNAWTGFFTQAIAPSDDRDAGASRYEVLEIEQGDLDNHRFEDFSVVCLLDPKPIAPRVWKRLADYVEQGGAVGVFLGRNAAPPSPFNQEDAQRLLPGPLARQYREGGRNLFIDIRDFSHPITSVFRQRQTSIPWDRFPVFKHWVHEPLGEGWRVVAPFSNAKPAIFDRELGKGRVIVTTTPLSEPSAGPTRRAPWNELASGENNWPPFALAVMTMRHLTASAENQLNFQAGQTVVLPNNPSTQPERYQLFTPQGQPADIVAREGRVTVSFTESAGAYRLKGLRGEPVIRGFAVNLPLEASDLTRIERSRLDEIIGADRYQFARRRDEIERVQGAQRVGREFYPFLIALLAIVMGLENLLANRFYPADRHAAEPAPST